MINKFLTMVLCVSVLNVKGQGNYSISHRTYSWTNNGLNLEEIDLQYINYESYLNGDSLNNRIGRYIKSNYLRASEFGLTLELTSHSLYNDTVNYTNVDFADFAVLEGFNMVYLRPQSYINTICSKSLTNVFLQEDNVNPNSRSQINFIGDTVRLITNKSIYINYLHIIDLNCLLLDKYTIYVDTVELSQFHFNLYKGNTHIYTKFIKTNCYFWLLRTDLDTFKNSIRNIYFEDITEVLFSPNEGGDEFVDYKEISRFLKRRMWISRFHLLFVKRKFKH